MLLISTHLFQSRLSETDVRIRQLRQTFSKCNLQHSGDGKTVSSTQESEEILKFVHATDDRHELISYVA